MTESTLSGPPDAGHADRARTSVIWNAGFTVFRDALQLGVTLLLVRLLPPDAYGQFGFVTALISFLTLCSFREFLNYTLLVRDPRDVHPQDHFTAGLVIQVAVFAAANVIALVLRAFPAYAPVAPLVHVMSVLFLLDLPGEFRVRMIERALDWRRLRSLHAAALVAGSALSIVMAFGGWGAYALLVPTLLVPLPFIYDLFVREGWRPTWAWSWSRFQPAWRFGLQRIAAASLAGATPLVESAWIGRVLGFAAFGVLGRALGLSVLICGRLTSLLGMAIYPVVARIEPRTEAYRRASALYLRSVVWVVVPLAIAGSLVAGPVVQFLYGDQWLSVIPLMPVALAAAALAGVAQTGYMLLLAHHRQDTCFVVDLWRLTGTVIVLAALVRLGLDAYLSGLVAVNLVALAIVLRGLYSDRAVSSSGLVQALMPPAVAAACAAGLVWAGAGLARANASSPQAAFRAGLFIVLYVAAIRVFFGEALQDLVGYFPRQRQIKRFLLLRPVSAPPEC